MAQLIFKVWQLNFKRVLPVYVCQNMLKNEISVHKFCPQSLLKPSVVHFQGIAMKFWKIWMRFKGHRWRNSFFNPPIFSGVWMRFKGHRWRNSFLNPSKKNFLAFEWDLRDTDGATHFQGMAMKFKSDFPIYVCQNMLKNEISIHKFCPQSVFKPSVVHFQGVAMIFFEDLNGI